MVLALATAACGGGDGREVAVVGQSAPEDSTTTSTTVVEETTTTTTVVALPPPPPPTFKPKPAMSTTTTTAPPAAYQRPYRPAFPMSPLEPGTRRSGSGDLGAEREVVQGPTRLVFSIYLLDSYESEPMEAVSETHDEGVVRYVHVDFGDGEEWEANWYYSCYEAANTYKKPNPIYHQSGRHFYAAPGDYKVTITLKTVRCTSSGPDYQEIEPNTIVTSITAHHHAGPRPELPPE